MDSGLKERLVGAAVLVALGVWLIPWILNGRDDTQDVADGTADAVMLPVADAPVRTQTRTIDLADDGRAGPDAEPQGGSPAPAAVAPAGDTRSAQRADPDAGERQDTAPPAKVAEVAAEPPSPRPAEPEPAAPAAAADGWFVQLGSFGDEDNAERLAGRVATFGYKAEVSTYRAGGRTLNRVRVGPSATRDEASAVASSLAAHGFVAQVVSAD